MQVSYKDDIGKMNGTNMGGREKKYYKRVVKYKNCEKKRRDGEEVKEELFKRFKRQEYFPVIGI